MEKLTCFEFNRPVSLLCQVTKTEETKQFNQSIILNQSNQTSYSRFLSSNLEIFREINLDITKKFFTSQAPIRFMGFMATSLDLKKNLWFQPLYLCGKDCGFPKLHFFGFQSTVSRVTLKKICITALYLLESLIYEIINLFKQ